MPVGGIRTAGTNWSHAPPPALERDVTLARQQKGLFALLPPEHVDGAKRRRRLIIIRHHRRARRHMAKERQRVQEKSEEVGNILQRNGTNGGVVWVVSKREFILALSPLLTLSVTGTTSTIFRVVISPFPILFLSSEEAIRRTRARSQVNFAIFARFFPFLTVSFFCEKPILFPATFRIIRTPRSTLPSSRFWGSLSAETIKVSYVRSGRNSFFSSHRKKKKKGQQERKRRIREILFSFAS